MHLELRRHCVEGVLKMWVAYLKGQTKNSLECGAFLHVYC